MLRHFSSPILLTVMMLIGVGLVQVYSSSYIFAIESFGSGYYFFFRQSLFALLAIATMLITASLPSRCIEKYCWLLWVISAIGVVATFIPGLGVRVGGAIRWLQTPFGFRFEPSELLKFSFGIFFASLLVRRDNALKSLHWSALMVLLLCPLFLLLKQPDFGSFAIICLVGLALLFAFGLQWKYIFISLAGLIPAFYFLVMQVPYRKARVLAFLDPWSDPEQKGFQVIQSMLSFHSGGITGVGLGKGQGKLFFLPEAHTDFTLAVLGEEWGFLGFLAVLALYGFLIYKGFHLAIRTRSTFQKAAALGISLTFALSVFINCGVVLGMLPTKGLTMPFLSYGGSSLITLALVFGILINIEKSVENDS